MAVQATLAWEEEGRRPRAQRGPVAGATTKFSLAPSIGVFGFVPVWARSIFSSSRVVVRVWCLMPRSSAALLPAAVLCGRVRRARRAGWRARARCCSVASVAVAAAACVLRLSRRRARVAWRVRAWRLRGARAGCCGGVRLASCRRCGRRARGFPCSCARDVVDAAAGRRRRGHGHGPRGEWSVFMASLAARVAQQRAGRWWCWRGAGGRCRSWPQRGRRRPLRARRLSGRGSGRVR